MVNIPLGQGAYKRAFAGEPEIVLENRYLEKNITNLREGSALISRCGTTLLQAFGSGKIRRVFSRPGFMGSDLFIVSGTELWRWDGTQKTHIGGVISGTGTPQIGWMKGIGYEYMFITDGLLLQWYGGGSHAVGTLTWATPGAITSQVIKIGSTYYGWASDVSSTLADGSAAHPFLALLTADPMRSMTTLLNYAGTRGVDYSPTLAGPRTDLIATNDTAATAVLLIITANSVYTDGNSIATTVSGSDLAWGAATLTGGGVHALSGVLMPDGKGAKALSSSAGYVLVSAANSQQFFWLKPGAIEIDPLDYAEKESHPDNIVDMMEVGDQVLISGGGSTENWYATGNDDAPWLPVQGRVYQRGVVAGTMCAVSDSVIFVGDDGVVYSVGYGYGESAQWGVHRISDHGIEERIRIQRRREAGLST
jgi:hypothetical protein